MKKTVKILSLLLLTLVFNSLSSLAAIQTIVLKTNKAIDEQLVIRVNPRIELSVDWGDGVLVNMRTTNAYIIHNVKGETITLVGNISVLDCTNNKIKELDVSQAPDLQVLICAENDLKVLEITTNTNLVKLDCANNELTTLDLSKSRFIRDLNCANNQLTELRNYSGSRLNSLICYNNQINSLLTNINAQLTTLWCYNNNITELNIKNSGSLKTILCQNNQLTTLSLNSKDSTLYALWCDNNSIGYLNLSAQRDLQSLSCVNSALDSIDWFTSKLGVKEYKDIYYSSNRLRFSSMVAATRVLRTFLEEPILNFRLNNYETNLNIDLTKEAYLGTGNVVSPAISFELQDGTTLANKIDYKRVTRNVYTFIKPYENVICKIRSMATITGRRTIQSEPFNVSADVSATNNLLEKICYYSVKGKIIVTTTELSKVSVINILGQEIYADFIDGTKEIVVPQGIYILNNKYKISVK